MVVVSLCTTEQVFLHIWVEIQRDAHSFVACLGASRPGRTPPSLGPADVHTERSGEKREEKTKCKLQEIRINGYQQKR